MTRTALIYARLQSQRSGSARHVRYLLDGHGSNGPEVHLWTKGIPKSLATTKDLPGVWAGIDRQWKQEKREGGTVATQSKVTYMQSLIALPNDISDVERHSLAKQILRLFPQKHPVTVVAHDYSTSGLPNRHLHIAFSYRMHGYGKVDRELQQGFEKNLKTLLHKQYKKYGFTIEENMKKHQVRYKPQTLMRILLKKYGREKMKSPIFLSTVVLAQLKDELEKCQQRCAESNSDANVANLVAAEKSVAWLSLEISKAQSLKYPSRVKRRSIGADHPFGDDRLTSTMSISPRGKSR